MDRALPDFKAMPLRKRMDWLSDASKDASKFVDSLQKDTTTPELKAKLKGLCRDMKDKPVDKSPLRAVKIGQTPKGVIRDYGAIRVKNQSGQFVGRSMVHTVVHNGDESNGQVVRHVEGPTQVVSVEVERTRRDGTLSVAKHAVVMTAYNTGGFSLPVNDPTAKRRDGDNTFKAYGATKAKRRIESGDLVIVRK